MRRRERRSKIRRKVDAPREYRVEDEGDDKWRRDVPR